VEELAGFKNLTPYIGKLSTWEFLMQEIMCILQFINDTDSSVASHRCDDVSKNN